MIYSLMQNVIVSDPNKKGVPVKIKVLAGPFRDKEFQANKVQETINGQTINCYHVADKNLKTYFVQDVVVEI